LEACREEAEIVTYGKLEEGLWLSQKSQNPVIENLSEKKKNRGRNVLGANLLLTINIGSLYSGRREEEKQRAREKGTGRNSFHVRGERGRTTSIVPMSLLVGFEWLYSRETMHSSFFFFSCVCESTVLNRLAFQRSLLHAAVINCHSFVMRKDRFPSSGHQNE
jgi:hypothetical protein